MKKHTIRVAPIIAAAGAAVSLLTIQGCSQNRAEGEAPPLERRATSPVLPWDASGRPVSEVLASATGTRSMYQGGTRLVSRHKIAVPANETEGFDPAMLGTTQGELVRVKYAVRNAEVSEVLRVLIGEYLDRSYVVDPKIAGVMTFDIDEEMTKQDLMDLLGGLAMLNGWIVEDRSGTLFIRPSAQMGSLDSSPILKSRAAVDADTPAVRVRRLRYIAAPDIDKAVKPIMSSGGQLLAAGRTLVIVDTIRQLNRVSRLISTLDVPEFDGVEIWTYALVNRAPESAATLLTNITAQSRMVSGGEPLAVYVPFTGTNRLMVISRDMSVQSTVRDLIAMVDQPSDREARGRFLYRTQYYDPAALDKILRDTFAGRIEAAGTAATRDEGGIRIVLDPLNGTFVITATPDDYAEMMTVVRALDRPPQQVRIQSMIVEVGLTNALQWGVEYFLRALDKEGIGILELAGATSMPINPTGSAFFVGSDGLAIITALQRETDINILSLPELFVMNNTQGEIQVGGQTPVVTSDIDSQTQNQGTTGIRREIEYRDTGVSLRVQPKINETGEIVLTIEQEVTDVGQQTEFGPEFTTRKINTVAVIPHGQTLLLGGIIQRGVRNNVDKIPILGDIPIVGMAFRSYDNREERTELLLSITPTIINSPSESAAIMSDFLAGANAVRATLEDFAAENEGSTLLRIERFEPDAWDDAPDQPDPKDDAPHQPPLHDDLPPDIRRILERSAHESAAIAPRNSMFQPTFVGFGFAGAPRLDPSMAVTMPTIAPHADAPGAGTPGSTPVLGKR